MCILLTHFSENGRFGRSPKPSNPKRKTFSRLLRGLRFVSKLAVLPQGSPIFRIHILLKLEILFLEAYRFQNSEGLEGLRTFIGVETAALTFRTKQYSTSYSSHICYGKRFYNDFFLNHHTVALVNICLKLLSCVVIETALDLMKKNQLS